MPLYDVVIDRRDTCLTYSLKRVGLSHLIYMGLDNIKKLSDYFHFVDFDIDDVEIGDIILWNKFETEVEIPMSITKDSVIHNTILYKNIHLGVVERNNIFSDVTRKIYSGIPCIRLRDFNDIRLPDYKIILKNDGHFKI